MGCIKALVSLTLLPDFKKEGRMQPIGGFFCTLKLQAQVDREEENYQT